MAVGDLIVDVKQLKQVVNLISSSNLEKLTNTTALDILNAMIEEKNSIIDNFESEFEEGSIIQNE
tara:strand:- start:1201 stop:1395 length:195 start_codon:yes stop_codon:yes gene_type:complete